jgi:hypothetical protein
MHERSPADAQSADEYPVNVCDVTRRRFQVGASPTPNPTVDRPGGFGDPTAPMNFLTRVPFDLNGPLTIAILSSPTAREVAVILCSDLGHMHIVVQF